MKTKLTAILTACLLIAFTFARAQTGITLRGSITGVDGHALDGATVYLNRAADSTLVKTALAAADGTFGFNQLKAASYRVVISMVGYQTYKSGVIDLKQDQTLPAVALQQQGTTLKEVSVSAQRPPVEHLIDRTVVNVDALISNAGSTAMDVLEKSPGVMVDQNNNAISLKGKSGVTIFIDDKPTYLSGDDLANYLRSLPSSSIDRIELMTNPPAKYDAAGNGGVINIRLKHIRDKGFNGNLNLAATQGKRFRSNNSVNLNLRQNKLNVAASFSYLRANGYNDLTINRYFDQSVTNISPVFIQRTLLSRTADSYNSRISMDYYATDKTTFGIGLTGLIVPAQSHTVATSSLLSAQNKLDSTIVADNNQHRNFKNGGINFNYRHEYDKKGRELTVDLDYLKYQTQFNQSFDNSSYTPAGVLYHNDLLTGMLPANVDIYSAKTDYTHPLASGIKLSAGLKTSYTQTDNIADYFYTFNNITTPDYGKTNHFIYKENINAAYINANRDFKRFSIQAGLRFENTVSNGHQLGNVQVRDSSFRRNYNSLFPTFYLQYKLDTTGRQSLSFNYGRRIDRPYYADLNPFLSPLDKFTYYTGNPYLQPSYTHNFELAYAIKGITFTLDYTHVKNDVGETIEILNGIYYSRPGNIGNIYVWEFDVDGNFDLAKWVSLHMYVSVNNTHTVSNFYNGVLDTKGNALFTHPVLTFKPGKDWTLQVDGIYASRVTAQQFIFNSRQFLNAAIAKKLSPVATLKFAMNDIFYSQVNAGIIGHLAGTQANYRNLGDSRNGTLSFSYRFGKAIKNQREHKANGAESEQNRVKN